MSFYSKLVRLKEKSLETSTPSVQPFLFQTGSIKRRVYI